MNTFVTQNGQRYLCHAGSNQGYLMENRFAIPTLVTLTGGTTETSNETVYSHIDDKLHVWDSTISSFKAVPMKQYAAVFRDLNNTADQQSEEELSELEEENENLREQLEFLQGQLNEIRSALRNL